MDFTLLIYWTDFPLGGAMKPTTDGRWAHLACAIWIPGSWKHSFHFWSFNYLFIFSNALKIFQKPAYLMLREWSQLMGLVESTRYFLFHFLCFHTIMASFLCSPSPSFFLDICHRFYLYLGRICLWQRSHIYFYPLEWKLPKPLCQDFPASTNLLFCYRTVGSYCVLSVEFLMEPVFK